MKFLSVLTLPSAIYHGWYTWKTFWKDNFTLVNMKSCGRRYVRKHKEIKNGKQYIILDVSYNLDCLDKSEVTSSESKDYMVRSGKEMITSVSLSTKRSNKKQKASFSITGITNQDFIKMLKNFNSLTFLSCKSKQVRDEPAEA